jgi:hypothetical protein
MSGTGKIKNGYDLARQIRLSFPLCQDSCRL